MNKEKKLVPKLRFPEFRGAGEWSSTVLGEFSEVVRGGSPRPIDGFLTTAVDGLNWLKIGDVDKEAKYVTQTAEKVRPEALSKTRVVNPGDLILSNSMSFGRPYILQIKTCIHDGWIAVTHIADEVTRDFLYYLISEPKSQIYFLNNAAGSGVLNLNADIIKALPVCHPLAPEQQKIADCLSSLDELIAAQARKVDALKTHKKGLMQQLFPREGETQPWLRFPEFRDAGEWGTAVLGALSEVVRGGSPRPIDGFLTTAADGLHWLKIGDVDKDAKYVTKTAEKVRTEALNKTRVVNPGDLILSNSMSFGRPYILQIKTCIHDGWIAVTHITKRVERDFLYYLISSSKSQSYFVNNAAGSGVQNLNADIIKALPVCYPASSEQQRIASCLSSLDDLITAAIQELATLKTHKKGLMQQLFPSAAELAA